MDVIRDGGRFPNSPPTPDPSPDPNPNPNPTPGPATPVDAANGGGIGGGVSIEMEVARLTPTDCWLETPFPARFELGTPSNTLPST